VRRTNAFKYIFIIVIIALSIVTYLIYRRENTQEEAQKNVSQEQEETENVVKELRLAISGLDTINPIISANKHVQEISRIIFDSLVELDEHYAISGGLAEEIEKEEDNITYIIKLREGVKWSDGTDFTATDVKYTLDLLKSNPYSIYNKNVERIASYEVQDDHHIKLVLDQDVQFFEYNLTFPIMCYKYYEGIDFYNSEKTNTPIGTGMFMIESFDEKVIRLSKNPEYWNESKHTVLEKVNINVYGTMGEVYNDFKNGNVDVINTTQSSVNQYIGTIGFAAKEFDGRNYDFIAFNTANSILASSKVRRALCYYIDKTNTVASCYGNSYRQSDFPLDFGSYLYQADKIDNGYNSEIAGTLLGEDGWVYRNNSWQKANGSKFTRLTFTLAVNSDNATDVAIAENLKWQWANAGIQVTIRHYNNANYHNLLNSRTGYDAILVNYTSSFTPNLSSFFGSGNFSNYYNAEISQIMEECKQLGDMNQIAEKYIRILEIYNEEKPILSLAREKNLLVYNTNLAGNLMPTAYNIYNYIEKWYRKNY
jgi:peptide/nickel transport system substrate-binding protein